MIRRVGPASAAGLLFAGGFLTVGLVAGGLTVTSNSSCSPSAAPSTGSFTTTGGWTRVGATIDTSASASNPGSTGGNWNGGMSYAELGATPGYPNYVVGGLIGHALGIPGGTYGIPAAYPLLIRPVGSNSAGYRIVKSDIGSGQAGQPHYVIDLHTTIAALVHFSGKQDVEIRPAGNNPGISAGGVNLSVSCANASAPLSGAPSGYVNPVLGASLSRTDEGVDYTLGPQGFLAPADSVIVTTQGGWFRGNCIVAKILNGPYAGSQYFVGEGVQPAAGIAINVQVRAGTRIADRMVSPYNGILGNIEAGWWKGGVPLAQSTGGYTEGEVTAAGAAWDSFVRSLGGVAHPSNAAHGSLAGLGLGQL